MPLNVPVPVCREAVTVSELLVMVLPNSSWMVTTGWVLNASPEILLLEGWVVTASLFAAAKVMPPRVPRLSVLAWLMKLLKMTELPRDRKFMIKAAYTRIEDMTRDFVEELKTKSQHHGVNWRVVETERLTDKGKNCEFESCERDSFMSAWQEAFNMER